jgi:hypothetical protein
VDRSSRDPLVTAQTLPRRGSTWQFRHGSRGLVDVVQCDDADTLVIRYRNTGHRVTTTLASFTGMYDPVVVDPLPDAVLDSEEPW